MILTQHQVADYLRILGFAQSPAGPAFTCPGIEVVVLDAPRIVATASTGLCYIAVQSLAQLEEQLTSLLGFQRPRSYSAGGLGKGR